MTSNLDSKDWISALLLRTALAALTGVTMALILGMGIPAISPAQGASGGVTIPKNGVYTLEELAKLLREQKAVELYADRRDGPRQLFLSQGKYPVAALIEAVCRATGLTLREVDNVQFLASASKPSSKRLRFPILPKDILERLDNDLRPLAKRADLKKEGIPFEAEDFLAQKQVAFDQLSQAQQRFLVRLLRPVEARDLMAPGKNPWKIEEAAAEQGLERLRKTRVRFGTSYLMLFCVHTPSAVVTEPDGGNFGARIQVYYDYRDRLGVSLPEDMD